MKFVGGENGCGLGTEASAPSAEAGTAGCGWGVVYAVSFFGTYAQWQKAMQHLATPQFATLLHDLSFSSSFQRRG